MGALNVGVIGLGTISELHLDAYRDSPSAHLLAVCDIDASRAGSRAAEYGAVKVFTDYAELLADPEIDAVSICTRNDTHAEIVIAALEAGKHVLIEKPMTASLQQALAVVAAAQRSTASLQVAYVRRFSPNAEVLKRFIDAGDLGQIYYAKATCLRRVGNPGGWFADKTLSGGGPLIDLGVHFIDICWWLMGCPSVASVSGTVFHKIGARNNIANFSRYLSADFDPARQPVDPVEDLATALIKFSNGAVMHFDTSYSMHGTDETRVQVFGDKGGAQLEPALEIFTEQHDTLLDISPVLDSPTFSNVAYRNEVEQFLATARGEAPEAAPAAHGLELIKIISAIYESGRTGREVVL
ncbi:Gfo/Idh/MocA family protein [Arthrobacter sp. AZCC_0090]|uniref:Gfo/Idh/MocA family protein n=1 Tax=Arthrobacter sp. AZCC_0090 TaxID=2735881 RepID=UPI001609E1F7|nr:Gfo/Idh/MocA family oxidoreductase [Arthrobacter sp. AZCC_0090]MBB6406893.1 putative dehydrogenase [Arthrobacter sp. AZCC_0090]